MSDKCPGCGAALGPMSSTRVVGACPSCGKNIWCYRVCGFLKVAIDHRDARIAELEAIVAKLPKTADGVPAYKDMPVWCVMPDGSIYETELGWYCTLGAAFARDLAASQAGYRLSNGIWLDVGVPVEHCYSTPEAAEAAKEASND